MYSIITNDIKVSVIPEYDRKNSFPSENRFVFRYSILIENLSQNSVILQKRHWFINDFGFGITEVRGDGVIGLLPEILPGESFSYFSNVVLRSGIGIMYGTYLMKIIGTKESFKSNIPKFNLFAEILKN